MTAQMALAYYAIVFAAGIALHDNPPTHLAHLKFQEGTGESPLPAPLASSPALAPLCWASYPQTK